MRQECHHQRKEELAKGELAEKKAGLAKFVSAKTLY
jgi:hypothetical protein